MTNVRSIPVIAFDGPAGVGKSTLAARTAEALGVPYLDTGAMFRTVALYLRHCLAECPEKNEAGAAFFSEGPRLQTLLEKCVFSLEGTGKRTRLFCNDRVVGDEIRNEETGMMAAVVGRVPQVRAFLKKTQREMGESRPLVAEGRDMGTEVFPDACCKIFLDADPEIRARRRYGQLQKKGVAPGDLAELTEQIRLRDDRDRKRSVAPLQPATDAHVLDTSRIGIEEVFSAVMKAIAQNCNGMFLPVDTPMRRKDRILDRNEALLLLEQGEYCVMAVNTLDKWPYAVPLSYVVMDGAVYFHCAQAGRKITAVKTDNRVCLTVIGSTRPVFKKGCFTAYYKSVMVFGRAVPVRDTQEKHRSLCLFAKKYLPEHLDKADEYSSRLFTKTAVYRVLPEQITGKANYPYQQARALCAHSILSPANPFVGSQGVKPHRSTRV